MSYITYSSRIKIKEITDEIKRRLGSKADSTFTGTQEEWDALSIEEKAKYPTTYIINNYSSGSGSGSGNATLNPEDQFRMYVSSVEPDLGDSSDTFTLDGVTKFVLIRPDTDSEPTDLYAVYSDGTRKSVDFSYINSTSNMGESDKIYVYHHTTMPNYMFYIMKFTNTYTPIAMVPTQYSGYLPIILSDADRYWLKVSGDDTPVPEALYISTEAGKWESVDFITADQMTAPTNSGQIAIGSLINGSDGLIHITLAEDYNSGWLPVASTEPHSISGNFSKPVVLAYCSTDEPPLITAEDTGADYNWYWAETDNESDQNIIAMYKYTDKGWRFLFGAATTTTTYRTYLPSERPTGETKNNEAGMMWLTLDADKTPQALYTLSYNGTFSPISYVGYGTSYPSSSGATANSYYVYINNSADSKYIILKFVNNSWTTYAVSTNQMSSYPAYPKLTVSKSEPPEKVHLGSRNTYYYGVLDNHTDKHLKSMYKFDSVNGKWVLEYNGGGKDFELGTGLKWDENGNLAIDFEPVVNIEHAIVLNKEEATDP